MLLFSNLMTGGTAWGPKILIQTEVGGRGYSEVSAMIIFERKDDFFKIDITIQTTEVPSKDAFESEQSRFFEF